jgi:hypothetical protein
MMRSKILFSLLMGAAVVVLSLSCAPVDSSASNEGPPASVDKIVAEKLPPPTEVRITGPQQRIRAAIDNIRERDLLTTNGFWTVFHGILGLGPSTMLRNPETGERINAIDYICNGGELRGLRFIPTKDGLDVQIGPQFVGQGHQDQFIAEMGQWGMPAGRKFIVNGKDYTFLDFVNHAKMRARINANQELSWAVVVVGQYLGTDITWTNSFGEELNYEDLVRYELNASVEDAACGGTHRLFGLTWASYLHQRQGGQMTGLWKEVDDKLARYKQLARDNQNPDGSFSTNFFRGPGNASDMSLRINSTGHTLEWLALALTDEELKERWVQDAANALSLMILDIQGSAMEGGTLYHAVHGLLMYYSRVYDRESLGPLEPLIPLPPTDGKGPAKTAEEIAPPGR